MRASVVYGRAVSATFRRTEIPETPHQELWPEVSCVTCVRRLERTRARLLAGGQSARDVGDRLTVRRAEMLRAPLRRRRGRRRRVENVLRVGRGFGGEPVTVTGAACDDGPDTSERASWLA